MKRGREAKDEQSGVVVDFRLRENIVAGGAQAGQHGQGNSAGPRNHSVSRYAPNMQPSPVWWPQAAIWLVGLSLSLGVDFGLRDWKGTALDGSNQTQRRGQFISPGL